MQISAEAIELAKRTAAEMRAGWKPSQVAGPERDDGDPGPEYQDRERDLEEEAAAAASANNGEHQAQDKGQEQPTRTAAELGIWNAGARRLTPPPRGWLLGNQFCRGFLSSLDASGGTGKTAVRTLQTLSMATLRELSGEHVFKRCRVLAISFEDGKEEQERRVLAAMLPPQYRTQGHRRVAVLLDTERHQARRAG
jgi:hypothetical protein